MFGYRVGFTPNPGFETLVYQSPWGPTPPTDIDGTGLWPASALTLGPRGSVAVFNLVTSGLPGLQTPGLYTQPLTPRS